MQKKKYYYYYCKKPQSSKENRGTERMHNPEGVMEGQKKTCKNKREQSGRTKPETNKKILGEREGESEKITEEYYDPKYWFACVGEYTTLG